MNAPKWDLFLAHPPAEQAVAEQLYDLIGSRLRVFLSSKSVQLGDLWDDVVPTAQREALITVVLVSEHSDKSWYQRDEIAAAIDLAKSDGRRVVPVLLRGTPPESLPYGLRRVHPAHVRTPAELATLADKLVDLTRARATLGAPLTARAPAPPPVAVVVPPHPPEAGVATFVLSASTDGAHLDELRKHLYLAQKSRVLHLYTLRDEDLLGGSSDLALGRMDQAALLVLLVSASLFTEQDALIDRALARAAAGARVVPVLLGDVDLTGSRLRELVALPRTGGPISRWRDRDAAWAHVAGELRRLAESLRKT